MEVTNTCSLNVWNKFSCLMYLFVLCANDNSPSFSVDYGHLTKRNQAIAHMKKIELETARDCSLP